MTVSIEEEFARITEHWSPRIIADANGQSVKLAKVKGEFVWHDHAGEDELFFIVKGNLTIRYRDRADAVLKAGDIHVVPRGVEHNPIAEEECWLMLFEPAETRHTGNVDAGLTKSVAEQRAHLQPADD